jgi:hypothetical protein
LIPPASCWARDGASGCNVEQATPQEIGDRRVS